MEPVTKKLKPNNISDSVEFYINELKNDRNLKAVLCDSVNQPIPLIQVTVGIVNNVSDLSTIVKVLNEKLPLKELTHLKRVRSTARNCKGVVICPSELLNDTIQDYLNKNVSEIADMFSCFEECSVPKYGPVTKKQFSETKKYWSCNFHPNEEVEKAVSDNYFNIKSLKTHKYYMELAFHLLQRHLQNNSTTIEDVFFNVTIVVDPTANSIVAIGLDKRYNHPTQHAALVAIDNVAKTQGGGAWKQDLKKDLVNCGINEDIQKYLTGNYPEQALGLQKDSKIDPYLCTGYIFYMLREPCVMCAMGMVHARVKQVFFALNNKEMGALKSTTKLHTIQSLNHRYEVFTGFLDSET